MDPVAKSLDGAGTSWTFLDGSKRSAVILKSVAIGRGEYLPGWRWSLHAGKLTGKSSTDHIGYVLSGRMAIRAADGRENMIGPGEAFEVGPGHDAWVVGNEPCVALDFERLK
jgi:quercetin dioxygenase-like cupin family protein